MSSTNQIMNWNLQIQELKHRYFRTLDNRDFTELGKCFSEDVTIDYGPAGRYASRSEFLAMLDNYSKKDTARGLHYAANHEVDFHSDSTASVRWTTLYFAFDKGMGSTLLQAGTYNDTCERLNDEWVITSSRYELWFHSGQSFGVRTPLFPVERDSQ